jgi:beta-ureidopropionase / N-carbamoyl-L-amino-acid hydrolase
LAVFTVRFILGQSPAFSRHILENTAMQSKLRINGQRLQRRLDELARIGALETGGVCRLAFSKEDKDGRDYVAERMSALGLALFTDAIGNTMGVRRGREQGPAVVCGSHTDTVATGGRFDGSVGVLAGLEAVESLNEADVTTLRPLAVMNFVNEEGARFMPDMMGSLMVRGDLDIARVRGITGGDGISIGAELDRFGFAGSHDFRKSAIGCYVELHIEQGPILEQEGMDIGIVEGVQGIRWITFSLRGAAAHAGATPIQLRHDAAYVAGAIVQQARELSLSIEGQRATVGSLKLSPNLVNVVAEQALLTVDLRNPDAARLDEAEEQLYRFVSRTCAAEGVGVDHEKRVDVPPVKFDAGMVRAVEASTQSLGYSSMSMTSGAGHDAQIMASICPTAMIFVPSHAGVSHNIHEYTAPGDIERGANVLLHTLLSLAGGAGIDALNRR